MICLGRGGSNSIYSIIVFLIQLFFCSIVHLGEMELDSH